MPTDIARGPGGRRAADLIRQAAQHGKSGLLSLSRGQITKGIYFEGGTPVAAVSSLPEEQLETRLVEQGHASRQLIDCARLLCSPKPIGRYLVDQGLVAAEAVAGATRDLAMRIALSLFEWDQCEFALDEAARHHGEKALECTAAGLIVIGSRRAAGVTALAEIVAPRDKLVTTAKPSDASFTSSAHLNSVIFLNQQTFLLVVLQQCLPV